MCRLSLVFVITLSMAFAPLADAAKVKWPWKSKAKVQAKAQTKEVARVERDVQKLESLLATVKASTKLSEKSWKSVANEADTLASRIFKNVKSATSDATPLRVAEQLRTHVQNMKKEALAGDYKSTRRHAAKALDAAAQLDEWAG